jgi:hypothetical protein
MPAGFLRKREKEGTMTMRRPMPHSPAAHNTLLSPKITKKSPKRTQFISPYLTDSKIVNRKLQKSRIGFAFPQHPLNRLHPNNATFKYRPFMTLFFPTALIALTLSAAPIFAQTSPPATESLKINGKSLTIAYCAPSVRARKIFGDGGLISNDPNYPVWRAGANSATAFHTDANLAIAGLAVPKGDYTLYALIKNPDAWELIVNKQTGQWGLEYDAAQDLASK